MNISLRKGPVQLYFAYRSRGSTNNLSGEDFALEIDGGTLTLAIDVSRNLRVRNKAGNDYLDALQLARDHADLDHIQIDDQQVLDGLERQWKRVANLALRVSLGLGERGTFLYRAEIEELRPGSARLTLHPVA